MPVSIACRAGSGCVVVGAGGAVVAGATVVVGVVVITVTVVVGDAVVVTVSVVGGATVVAGADGVGGGEDVAVASSSDEQAAAPITSPAAVSARAAGPTRRVRALLDLKVRNMCRILRRDHPRTRLAIVGLGRNPSPPWDR